MSEDNKRNEKAVEAGEASAADRYRLLYAINDNPPWYLNLIFGLQHFLLSFSSIIGVPFLLAPHLCLMDDTIGNQGRAHLISTIFVVSGITSILQTTVGNRLPVLQGSTFAFIAPTLAILAIKENKCPGPLPPGSFNSSKTLYNDTDGSIVDGEELWMRRMRVVQGSMAVASVLEFLLGATGAVTWLLRFIGPLTIAPTITLIGLDLFAVASKHSSVHWGIAVFSTFTLVLTSQYLKNVSVPFPAYNKRKKFYAIPVPLFKTFPVFITILLGCLLTWICTVTNILSPDPSDPTYKARIDYRAEVVYNSPWFRVPYPFQWGLPRVSLGAVIGMMAGVVASIVESVGDYHACAKLAEAPPPPHHAINRGIMVEGFGCIFAGIVGSGSGTTSFSENIAAIGITRVGSRRVLQVAGLVFVVFGVFGKIGSLFVIIPEPVMGGVFMVVFSLIAAVGLSNLQYADMNSPRNIFVVGFPLFVALSIANWVKVNSDTIKTGVSELDQIIAVFLQSSILVGGLVALFFDNTLPGTPEERGIVKWKNSHSSGLGNLVEAKEYEKVCYNLPISTKCRLAKYLPFLPEHGSDQQENTESTSIHEDVEDPILQPDYKMMTDSTEI